MGRRTLVETNEITIIDFSKIINATLPLDTGKEVLKIADQLKEAFSHRGVVYLINHGISQEEAKNMYSIMEKFVALPNDVKEMYRSQQRKNLHGYVPQNSEVFYSRNKFEIRESFNIIGDNRPFPTEKIPEYTQAVKNISEKFLKISNLLLELFAISQDANPDILVKSHKDKWNHLLSLTGLRIMYYPPVDEEPHPGIIRCGEHTDYGTFTLLMQDSEGGLEVCGENGEWRRVGYIPGAIFLNTSDLLEVWTSKQYKATLHRVVVPEESDIRHRGRYSMGFFVFPDNAAVIRPFHPVPGDEVKELIAGDHIGNKLDKADAELKK